MSNEGRNSKRQKGDEKQDEQSAAAGLGGPMYDEATGRKMLETARSVRHIEICGDPSRCSVVRTKGFDPNDAALDNIALLG